MSSFLNSSLCRLTQDAEMEDDEEFGNYPEDPARGGETEIARYVLKLLSNIFELNSKYLQVGRGMEGSKEGEAGGHTS